MPFPLAFILIGPDGTVFSDWDGRRFEFATRADAERACAPGERVQVVKAGEGVPAEVG